MYNPWNSEVALKIDGEIVHLRMTLGAIAALEAALEVDDLSSLVTRFSEGRYRAQDLILVLNAGLYGAKKTPNIELSSIEGGAVEAAKAAANLLVNAFPRLDAQNAL